jgi:hypothetical protein
MTDPVENGKAVQSALSDDGLWDREYGKWRRARLRRVQDSARVWLGVLTTLLGLLGSVVLFKGGSLVTGVTSNGWWQTVLIVLIGIVFSAAVLAVVVGGVATWGGLKDIPPVGNPQRLSPNENGGKPNENRGKWGRLLFRGVLTIALIPKQDREKALEVFGGKVAGRGQDKGDSSQTDLEVSWQKYRNDIVDNADRNRLYLHASRVLGVFAAVFIAILAIVAVVAGTVAPAPSDVIVVHHGQLSCGPVVDSTKYTDVTHVVPVTSC